MRLNRDGPGSPIASREPLVECADADVFIVRGANAVAIGGSVLSASNGTDVQAYDAGGSAGCSRCRVTCTPLRSAPGTNAIIASGTLYVSTTDPPGDEEITARACPVEIGCGNRPVNDHRFR